MRITNLSIALTSDPQRRFTTFVSDAISFFGQLNISLFNVIQHPQGGKLITNLAINNNNENI
jgi:hypothetical protein